MTIKITEKQYDMMITALKIAQSKAQEWRNSSDDIESFDHYADLLQNFCETETALRVQVEDGENE